MLEKLKLDTDKTLIIVFLCILTFCIIHMWQQSQALVIEKYAIELIEKINSGVQRVVKLELDTMEDTELFYEINSNQEELISIVDNTKYFKKDEEVRVSMNAFIDELYVFETSIVQFRETNDRTVFFQESENYYTIVLGIITEIKEYLSITENAIIKTKTMLVGNVAILILLLLKVLIKISKELKINKELSKQMFIDTSTGLYNRSKCQEILKNPIANQDMKERAIIIFDLNDLKKTNDGEGHRAGDDLISSFALQLKNATNVFSYEVFVGRYGGDEFMAYFASTIEDDVKLYIKEVEYLLDNFNETENKPFKLSCAAGYCITTAETKNMTMRELFDIADETMYKNKLAMKEKRRQELAEKGIKLEEVIDERLL